MIQHHPGEDLLLSLAAGRLPEAQALAIRTRYGTVMHTGDWKLDPNPLIGPPTDEAAFARLSVESPRWLRSMPRIWALTAPSIRLFVAGSGPSAARFGSR